jgi:hypothetical protein
MAAPDELALVRHRTGSCVGIGLHVRAHDMIAPRVSRFDLELWSRMAKQAEAAARTEDAPTAFGIVSALASYLDAALEPPKPPLVDRWQRDYDASHPDVLEAKLRRVFGR